MGLKTFMKIHLRMGGYTVDDKIIGRKELDAAITASQQHITELHNLLKVSRAKSSYPTSKWNEWRDEILKEKQ